MPLWMKYGLVGAAALLLGFVFGLLARPAKPVDQPAVVQLEPLNSDLASRRFVVVNPKSGRVVLYDTKGGELQVLDTARY